MKAIIIQFIVSQQGSFTECVTNQSILYVRRYLGNIFSSAV
jgi:hypothetical protein